MSDTPTPAQEPAAYWDTRFAPGGSWEAAGGLARTETCAREFCRNSILVAQVHFTLLDVSCALGNAMPILRGHFVNAHLVGHDVSQVAVERAQADYGHLAEFAAVTIEATEGHHDVILCSHTLEHFANHRDVVRHLLRHCSHLSVIVPYDERDEQGLPLQVSNDGEHQSTFVRSTLDFLLSEGSALSIRQRVYEVQAVRRRVLNLARIVLGRPRRGPMRDILYEICSAHGQPNCAQLQLHG